ncbi:E3 ubiquitin ligase family protein [Halovivax cerinus]|uniref:E3 ubiquitin ligase family protein n=1 Tax=Halovivax cerinus TaxID=1487865 RepID=A0ABD5NLX0_9EURY|nr:E3 ubiquitin ligase family protein [Halovivax cerinus]
MEEPRSVIASSGSDPVTTVDAVTSPGTIVVVGVLVAGIVGLGTVAAVAVGYAVRELRLAHRILRSGTESVLETPDGGYVELRGTVDAVDTPLEAPFSGAACVACEYAVEEERSTQNGTHWATIESGSRVVSFRLDDGTGSVLVDPAGCDLRLDRDDRIRVDGGTVPPPRIQAYIDQTESVDDENETLDLRVIELRTGANRRYIEKRLDVGATAHVLGTARYDTTAATGAGHVNAVVGVADAARAPGRWRRLRHRLFGLPFVLSDRSERRLALTAGAIGLGIVGGLLGAIGVAGIVFGPI